MTENIEALVTQYDRGDLSRRQLLQALAVITASRTAAPQTPNNSLTKGRNLHHVNVRVSDVARSEAFYRRLFGLPASRVVQGPDNHGLDLPGGGLIILQRANDPGRIDHLCIGVDNFSADRLRTAVRSAGIGNVQGEAADNFAGMGRGGRGVEIAAADGGA